MKFAENNRISQRQLYRQIVIACILGAAFLLNLLVEIVAVSLGTGIGKKWLCLITLLVCSLGTQKGIQRRGRMGEVSGGVVLAAVMLMLVLAVGQGKWEYFQEMVWNSSFSGRKIMESGYDVICAFSGLGLLPFALDSVGNSKDTGKTVSFAVFTLGILLILTELLLPSVFGWGRLKYESCPICRFWQVPSFQGMYWQDLMSSGWDFFYTAFYFLLEVFCIMVI